MSAPTPPPAPDRWFIRSVADMPSFAHPQAGTFIRFEPEDARFRDVGVNIHILQPGQPNGRYHAESAQEGFLVLSGECLVIVDEVAHPARAWDYVHCPAGTPHILVGAGDGPCAILMLGARRDGDTIHYPVNATAARYGASVSEPTDDPQRAYADWGDWVAGAPLPWPPPHR